MNIAPSRWCWYSGEPSKCRPCTHGHLLRTLWALAELDHVRRERGSKDEGERQRDPALNAESTGRHIHRHPSNAETDDAELREDAGAGES